MSNCPRILSVIEEYIGHRTYGVLMRDYFSRTDSCHVDFHWHNEDRELHTRVFNRLLSYYSKNPWVHRQNIDLRLFRLQLGFAYMGRRLVQRKLVKAKYNALHVHTQTLALLSLNLMRQYPTVISIDRTSAQAATDSTDPQFQWTFAPNIYLERKVFQAAKRIVSFSEAARQSVIKDYNIEPEKVTVVYPGVNLQSITPAAAPVDRELVNILFIGGDFDRKGGHDVLDVFLNRFSTCAKLHLVTGAAIECDHPNVHIYKTIKAYTPEWLQLYQAADMFVMPTYAEPFGWVFIEAMAAGLPIVATSINAIPEIVIQGETGLLHQPGDRLALAQSIQHLIDRPTLRREMGINGRHRVEQHFSVQSHFEKLESLLLDAALPQ